jgi:phosphoenolpyruvate carboxylase
MAKIVRLTENDLTRIVKRVIKEQYNEEIVKKVEDAIESPKIQNNVEYILDRMSDDDKEEMLELFNELNIDENSSIEEIHNKILEYSNSFHRYGGEMSEEESHSSAKHKAREILHDIGAANIAAWGGVPAAIAIGSMTGMPIGFAISWGVTGLLMGLAKALGKK